jgi:hypothetical protein
MEFPGMMSENASKICATAFSGVSVVAITPLVYAIIWFERDNHHRTLINQLVTIPLKMCLGLGSKPESQS